MSKFATILYGPPGAGKGTQAELLAKKMLLVHFDTGRYLELLLHSKEAEREPFLIKERENWDTGKLNTPSWVLEISKEKAEDIGKAGLGIVFSGSPRTLFEAFGDDKTEGLMDVLKKVFSKENIFIFQLEITQDDSLQRNSSRLVCSECGLPILAEAAVKKCTFCAGSAKKRILDDPKVIKVRWKEYKTRTSPIIKKLSEDGYNVINIDGKKPPYQVADVIENKLKKMIKEK